MPEIKRLPESVANQISAGEVVERPASVVKELVENSLDAGSNKILIEIENGGKDLIRVKDNGHGIPSDEIEIAFDRYATSKITDINDLYSLKSLGFRGEALASIASVSILDIISRTKSQTKAIKMRLKGGKVISKEPCGASVGTDIIVKDLFFNTPARYKYLKTTRNEFKHISNIITREALAYPGVNFTLIHNGRIVLKTPGTGKTLDCIYAIYGKEMAQSLVKIDYEDRYIKVSGYISRPDYYRYNRSYEIFFVNKRAVHNSILNRGVEEAYQGLLPPGAYPVVFLNLKLNPILVDVNVHPTKKEVKFSRDKVIKEVIQNGINIELSKLDKSPRLKRNINPLNRDDKTKDKSEYQKIKLPEDKEQITNKSSDAGILKNQNPLDSQDSILLPSKKNGFYSKKNSQVSQNKFMDINNKLEKTEINDNYKKDKHYKTDSINIKDNSIKENKNKMDIPIKRVLGQIKNTYIIAEGRDGLYIIDQHNAHERILYQSFIEKYNNSEIVSQPLVVPVNIETTAPEAEVLKSYLPQLEKMGFKLEVFGINSFIVREVPSLIKKRSNKRVVREVIDKLLEHDKAMKPSELINEIISYMSCRGAIKAGEYLDKKEAEQIIEGLFKTDNPYRCPHGRPIIIHITEDDINKGMGRK
ncbi:DNA mismatch repair endonuclease MutL [Halothermothrix orenii]|uniref:DNA mismatch repair protein MutL n=1 Tax=Halothermothrix orenii (strain H 168 / OCM 544 / DSM 9562) TaxID=373903 RepID=MUTL_HALOH|nr:DNA mismatch repair endonuclease MutL [Halothermothrix orenii]B8CX97.1 RecName: Full=DNA mismatch repair protein MutL [Halothermothrix orenii H 168]ACL69916.1 DNA mismatch repair protein MutL [Halothermothrix orenii H 168]